MRKITKNLKANDNEPMFHVGAHERVFYITADKTFNEHFDEMGGLKPPMLSDLTDTDLDNFKEFVLQKFPVESHNLIEMCIVKQDSKRGVFAGFNHDPTLDIS